MIAFDQPGTTRDSIYVDFEYGQRSYALIDTAGLRRSGKVWETVEKFSVVKTLQSIEAANVVILVLDAHHEISDQDAHIAGFILKPVVPWSLPSTNGTVWTTTSAKSLNANLNASSGF